MAMQAVVPVPLQPQPRSKSLTTDKWREAFPSALNETRCKNRPNDLELRLKYDVTPGRRL